MLNVGFPEARFQRNLRLALGTLVGLFLVRETVTAVVGFLGARSIIRPLETMTAVMTATRGGQHQRVGPVTTRDELGTLARELDAMLDLLAERNRQVQAADALEVQVAERTAELQRRSRELTHSIALLRQTRQALINAEKLAAVGELSAGLAHEINNPMAVIRGHIDLLASDLGSAADHIRGDIEVIVAQVYRVRERIDSLLRYVRPADFAGLLETIDVNLLVRAALPLVANLLRDAGIEVVLRLDATRTVGIGRSDLQ
jgi:two-component system NtrC family sensor kinase